MLWMAQRIHPPAETRSPKPKCRVTNWPEYNRALASRGEVTLWLDAATVTGWRAEGGKGMRYSDAAILCALCIRAAFRLPLRQTQGFLASFIRKIGLTIEVPHYSTIARRAAGLVVPRIARSPGAGPVHLAIDSTGLKVYGEGEWKVRTHGADKRRVWLKLQLAVDTATGELLAHSLTPNARHDGQELTGLLDAVEGPVAAVCGDGAYDGFASHAASHARGARPVIPPRKGAAITPPSNIEDPAPTRAEAVRRIIEIGRKAWKRETGYNRRSLAETAMGRYKGIIGPVLKSRTFPNQKTEAATAVRCLNVFTGLGRPVSVKIA